MESLADKVQLAKDGYENAMLYIIDLFEPLIGTYTALLNYDNKDSRSDLIEKLIKVVKVGINLKDMDSNSNGAVFNYIRSSLNRQYILLSKASQKIRDHETLYDQESLIEMAEKGSEYAPDSTDDSIVIDRMNPFLLSESSCTSS